MTRTAAAALLLFLAYPAPAAAAPPGVENPPDGAVMPADMAPPEFRWEARGEGPWLLEFSFSRGGSESFKSAEKRWRPGSREWEGIRARARGGKAVFTARPEKGGEAVSSSFAVSVRGLAVPIFYREVVLPFSDAVKDPSLIRWRLGRVSDPGLPPVVLDNLPVCGNCHSFSADGSVLGMDVDYANDKGSYALVSSSREITLDRTGIISWYDYRRGDGESTFGLLSQVSPDGRYAVSTVKDRSVFVARPDKAFSQLFFPVKGILAVYSREDGSFRALPGADDPAFVQSNPVWSPDGKYIVFARAGVHKLKKLRDGAAVLLSDEEAEEFVSGGKKFLFDLYRVPFNGGAGGKAEPLAGASANGMSNFFPRYSPDGKWIVFCKAKSFMLLQPDSELYIMPAAGGEPRRMKCNRALMNSWHSWSPDGRWLVFSSKPGTPYTRLYLTHIDENGNDHPPVELDWFTLPDRAANIPEFAPGRAGLIERIREKFLDAFSFIRSAYEHARAGDTASEIKAFARAVELDPSNAAAHNLLGVALDKAGRGQEAAREYAAAVKADPGDYRALANLATVRFKKGDLDGAINLYRRSLEIAPGEGLVQMMLADALGLRGFAGSDNPYSRAVGDMYKYAPPAGPGRASPADIKESGERYAAAIAVLEDRKLAALAATMRALQLDSAGAAGLPYYREAARLDPASAGARMNLGDALMRAGLPGEAAENYREALRLDPSMEVARRRLAEAGAVP